MKNIFIIIVLGLSLTSCNVQEKMTISENYEAKFTVGFDLSPLLKQGKSKDKDSTVSKKIDSSFSFSEMMNKVQKDSLSKMSDVEKKRFDELKDFKVHLKVDQEKNIMSYDFEVRVPNINNNKNFFKSSELAEVLIKSDKNFRNASALATKAEKSDITNTTYFYDGTVFIKKTLNKTIKSKKPTEKKKKKASKSDDLGSKFAEILKDCKYKIEYDFPKAIKTIDLKGAVISADKKSFVFEIPFDSYNKDMDLDFKIVFEP